MRSAPRLAGAPVISGNTGADRSCTVGGDAYGDATSVPIAKKDRKAFETALID